MSPRVAARSNHGATFVTTGCLPRIFSGIIPPQYARRRHARVRTRPVCLEALALVLHPRPRRERPGDERMSEAVPEMQFDSSLPRHRRARSVKRKKLGGLLYRDLVNCRTLITNPTREAPTRKKMIMETEGQRVLVHARARMRVL